MAKELNCERKYYPMITFFFENMEDLVGIVLPARPEALDRKLNEFKEKGFEQICYSSNGVYMKSFIDSEKFDLRQFNMDLIRLMENGVNYVPFLAVASVSGMTDFHQFVENLLQEQPEILDITPERGKLNKQDKKDKREFKKRAKLYSRRKRIYSNKESCGMEWKTATVENRTYMIRSAVATTG